MKPTVKLKRHFVRFYLYLSLITVLAAVFTLAPFLAISNAEEKGKPWIVIVFIVLSLVAIWSAWRFLRKSPVVTATSQHICFGNERYTWDEIEDISFNNAASLSMIYPNIMYGMAFRLKNGKEKYLLTKMYCNLWQLKLFVMQVVQHKQQEVKYGNYKVRAEDAEGDMYTWFRGNILFSYPMAILISGFLLLLFFFITNPAVLILLLLPVAIGAPCLVSSWLYAPGISGQYIAVSNLLHLRKKQYFRIADIAMVAFRHNAYADVLVIINHDMQEFSFAMGSLRRTDWAAIKNTLKSKGVKVWDELL
jgi:hypothetical protein